MTGRKGKCAALAVVLAALSSGAVEPAVNLFRDDFKEDENWGGFIDWECSMGTVEKLKETTPDGKPVIRITGGPEIYRYQIATETRKLKEGARYRLSALVRTKGLGALDMRQFQLRNSGWWQSGNADIPGDTGGKWQRISWEGELFPSRDQRYHGMICFSGRLPAGAYCDFAEPRLEGPAGDDFDVWKQESWPGRITPIDPLLSDVCAEAAKLTFYFPGRREDATERRILRATAGGRAVTAALGPDGRRLVAGLCGRPSAQQLL